MTPTPKLRFVERLVEGDDYTVKHARILQQWWKVDDLPDAIKHGTQDGVWRDVPLEEET